jgi:uncharacterized iron-regulated protein
MNRFASVSLWCCAAALVGAFTVLPGCAHAQQAAEPWQSLMPTPLLLLGEVHDAPEHQQLQVQAIRALAEQGALKALVVEMAEQGQNTTGLPTNASPDQVRQQLGWDESPGTSGWPWAVYGPVMMEAVRAGVPVLGGNLPRNQLRAAMSDAKLDNALDAASLSAVQQLVRTGHCDLLPESQIAPMARIQIARDRSMAQTAESALQPGGTVLLIAGNEHVRKDLGIPRHLLSTTTPRVLQALPAPADGANSATAQTAPERADATFWSASRPEADHCAALREMWQNRKPAR